MRLGVLAVSAAQPRWVEAAVDDYAKRFPSEWPFESIRVAPERRSANRSTERILAAEAARIRARLTRGARLIVCDQRGRAPTSHEFAGLLSAWSRTHPSALFVIGSADGTDATLRAEADDLLALSSMTLPHGLAYVLLIEQLYRAVSILRGGPYHRE